MTIAHERIKELRTHKNMTLSQVAEYLGVTEATAQRYETGKGIKHIPYETIEKYATLFMCTPQYIMGWESKENVTNKITANDSMIIDIIMRLLTDKDFFTVITELNKLDSKKLSSVKQMLQAFTE